MEEIPTAQANSLCYKGFMEEIPTAQADSLCYKGFSVYRSQGFALKIGFQVGKLNSPGGCVNILAALPYRSDLRHSTPLECLYR